MSAASPSHVISIVATPSAMVSTMSAAPASPSLVYNIHRYNTLPSDAAVSMSTASCCSIRRRCRQAECCISTVAPPSATVGMIVAAPAAAVSSIYSLFAARASTTAQATPVSSTYPLLHEPPAASRSSVTSTVATPPAAASLSVVISAVAAPAAGGSRASYDQIRCCCNIHRFNTPRCGEPECCNIHCCSACRRRKLSVV